MPLSRCGSVFLVLILLAWLHPLPAPAEALSLDVQTCTGVLYGLAKELVFDGAVIVSELDWRFQPVVYAGTALSVHTPGGFSAYLGVRSAFPARSGYIEDSDYLNYTLGDLRRTHYSRHDCYTERAVLLDARVGWSFRLGSVVALEPLLAFGLMQLKWTARDGYLQYPPEGSPPFTPWSPGVTKVTLSGTGIIYEQTYLVPAVGLSARARFARRMEAELRFLISPFVSCNALDNHVETDTDYYDDLAQGLLVEPTLSLGFRASERARLSLDVSYRGIFGLVGDTSEVPTGSGIPPGLVIAVYEDGAGASYSALDVSLGLSLSL